MPSDAMEVLTYLSMALLFAAMFGSFAAVAWLGSQLQRLRAKGVSPALLPDPTFGPRTALITWLWTDMHRVIGDRATSNAVLVLRSTMVIFVLAGAALVALGQFT
jgi:hypothetical protein